MILPRFDCGKSTVPWTKVMRAGAPWLSRLRLARLLNKALDPGYR